MPTLSRIRSAGTSSWRAGDRGVGHPARVLDQRLDATEGLAQGDHLGPAADLERGLLASGDPEADHAAEPTHLPLGQVVTRVRLQAREEDLLDPRVLGQEAATRSALSLCRSIRTASVFSPRSTSQESNGLATAADGVLMELQLLGQRPRRSRPARRRPRRSGRRSTWWWSARPRPRPAPAAAGGTAWRRCCPRPPGRRRRGRSRRWRDVGDRSSGLVGVSTQTAIVSPGRMAASTAARSVRCAGSVDDPPPLGAPARTAGTCRRTRRAAAPSGCRVRRSCAAGCPRRPGRWRTRTRAAALERGHALLQRGPGRVGRARVLVPAARPPTPSWMNVEVA